MKKMRKLLAVLMTLAMVMGMSLTSFAADEEDNTPKATDTTTATVQNVEAGCTVTAYQIVEADYNDFGFVKYVQAEKLVITGVDKPLADVTAPTSDEITVIAKAIANAADTDTIKELKAVEMKSSEAAPTTYTAELNAGYWVVIVNGAGDNAYNPMLIGVWYSESGSDNEMTSDPVDATTKWTLVTNEAFAKLTKATMDKQILNLDVHENSNGNDEAIGDEVYFQIDTTIPSYSASYKEVLVRITDTLSEGLTLDTTSIVIKVGGVVYAEESLKSDLVATTSGFEFTFPSDYALKNAGKAVVVTYTATLNEKAVCNSDENTNTVKYEYTRDPENKVNVKELTDTTYTHTYEISGEIIKVDENEHVLGGATFTLTNNETSKVYTAISDTDGKLVFTGLDVGTYTLVETVAPSGYSVDNTTHKVEVLATYNDVGTIKTSSIKVDDVVTSDAVLTENTEVVDEKEVTYKEVTGGAPAIIVNTKLSKLPSTGGIGTTIFTVGGCAIMIAAAYMFFKSRREEQ